MFGGCAIHVTPLLGGGFSGTNGSIYAIYIVQLGGRTRAAPVADLASRKQVEWRKVAERKT